MSDSDILHIARRATGAPSLAFSRDDIDACTLKLFPGIVSNHHIRRLAVSQSFLSHVFPVKAEANAKKINIVLIPLIENYYKRGYGSVVSRIIRKLAGRVTEDQFAATLLYGVGLAKYLGAPGWDIAVHYILNPAIAKNVSMALKALGANGCRLGAMLVEGESLQGRAVGQLSLDAEITYRCDPGLVADKVLAYSDELRGHIRSIIRSELRDRATQLPDLHDWWSARWLWCVNGSQTARSSLDMGLDPKRNRPTHSRDYRRAAAEALVYEPLTTWDGHTTVSASVKLEQGKRRAIFACDTTSYFAFSWILSAVERSWRNDRVLLDPGDGGHSGISKRVRNAQLGGGVNLMLDYDDFNSHHATATMQAVFEELCDVFNAPEWYRSVLVRSFDTEYIHYGGTARHVKGTLMSGHRGTTFINSVLNAAYIRMAIGAQLFDHGISIHTGDDVYMRCDTLSACEHVLYSAKAIGCRMNPSKQSIGFECAEFLRLGIGRDATYGYLTRAVASFVSGNWTTLDVMKPIEGLVSAINGCRTIMNRSGYHGYPALVSSALRYVRVPNAPLRRLLSGEVGLGDGPVYDQVGPLKHVDVCVDPIPPMKVLDSWASNGTKDYLTNHLTEVDYTALCMVQVDAVKLLVVSSYSKGLNQDFTRDLPDLRVSRVITTPNRGFVGINDLIHADEPTGVLSGYPIVRLLENRLSSNDLRNLVRLAGGNSNAADIRREAFGLCSKTSNIMGVIPYSDAASFSRRTTASNIFVYHNVYS